MLEPPPKMVEEITDWAQKNFLAMCAEVYESVASQDPLEENPYLAKFLNNYAGPYSIIAKFPINPDKIIKKVQFFDVEKMDF